MNVSLVEKSQSVRTDYEYNSGKTYVHLYSCDAFDKHIHEYIHRQFLYLHVQLSQLWLSLEKSSGAQEGFYISSSVAGAKTTMGHVLTFLTGLKWTGQTVLHNKTLILTQKANLKDLYVFWDWKSHKLTLG